MMAISKVEVVLDYVLERKGMDDYSRSIIDGRYYEQKFRLKRSGVGQVIYLVEGCDTEIVDYILFSNKP